MLERERLLEESTQRLSQPSSSRTTQKVVTNQHHDVFVHDNVSQTNANSSRTVGGWETIEKSRSSSQKRSRQLASLTTAPAQKGSSKNPLINLFPRYVVYLLQPLHTYHGCFTDQ